MVIGETRTPLDAPESGNLIVGALETYVAAERGIAPQVEGRIRVR